MTPSECPRCKALYADGIPEHFGSQPKCAFLTGVFNNDNWQCGTANAIRDIANWYTERGHYYWQDDTFAVVVGFSCEDNGGAMVYIEWYKDRGRTDRILCLPYGEPPRPITLPEAELLIQESKNERG